MNITIATVFAPNMIDLGKQVFAAEQAWRMPFLILGGPTLLVGCAITLSDIWIAILEVALALALVTGIFARESDELGPVLRSRDLWLINFAFIAVLWNLWFFSFWSVSIVADAAHSSFGRSALIAAFNAGAGILGFPIGGWLSDVSVRRGIGRKRLVLFTALQCALTVAFGLVITGGAPSVWLMAALLFGASTFFNAMQPIATR
jgi:MFS transporter, ACS family, D-galactonate transporter